MVAKRGALRASNTSLPFKIWWIVAKCIFDNMARRNVRSEWYSNCKWRLNWESLCLYRYTKPQGIINWLTNQRACKIRGYRTLRLRLERHGIGSYGEEIIERSVVEEKPWPYMRSQVQSTQAHKYIYYINGVLYYIMLSCLNILSIYCWIIRIVIVTIVYHNVLITSYL